MKTGHFLIAIVVVATTILACSNMEIYEPTANFKPTTIPNAPTNAIVVDLDSNTVQLTWADNSDNEDGFIISRGSRKYGWVVADTVGKNTTSYVDRKNNWWGKSLSYLILAYNNAGISSDVVSNELVFK